MGKKKKEEKKESDEKKKKKYFAIIYTEFNFAWSLNDCLININVLQFFRTLLFSSQA